MFDVRPQNKLNRFVIGQASFCTTGRFSNKIQPHGISVRHHCHPYAECHRFPQPARHIEIPPGAGSLFAAEPVQTVVTELLGISLVNDPGPAAGEDHQAVFRIIRTDICRQKPIIAAVEFTPGNRGAEHGTAPVGSQKKERSVNRRRPVKPSWNADILRFRKQKQVRCFVTAAVFAEQGDFHLVRAM